MEKKVQRGQSQVRKRENGEGKMDELLSTEGLFIPQGLGVSIPKRGLHEDRKPNRRAAVCAANITRTSTDGHGDGISWRTVGTDV